MELNHKERTTMLLILTYYVSKNWITAKTAHAIAWYYQITQKR
jgi:hypothetical protein